MLDMNWWKFASGRWVNQTGPTRQPAISTSGTSIIAEPVPAWADSMIRQSGCAARQASNTESVIMLVARCAGIPSASVASAAGVRTVIAPVSSSIGRGRPSTTISMRGKLVRRVPSSSVGNPSGTRRMSDAGRHCGDSSRRRARG